MWNITHIPYAISWLNQVQVTAEWPQQPRLKRDNPLMTTYASGKGHQGGVLYAHQAGEASEAAHVLGELS